jgi:hypothetical protein
MKQILIATGTALAGCAAWYFIQKQLEKNKKA